jgi:hypothetical protein
LPTDFQALSFTSPQMLVVLRNSWQTDKSPYESRSLDGIAVLQRSFANRKNIHIQTKAESQKTKCPRQKLTQAFWL